MAGLLTWTAPAYGQQRATAAELLSGQELIYSGRFGAAELYFARLAAERPRDPAGPALRASALIWWGAAQGDESFRVDSIDLLLGSAIDRARAAMDSAADSSARTQALFWLGVSYGYRGRQAEMRGSFWHAARDARLMRSALDEAVALDSACVDCLLGLGIYDYGLARAGTLARLMARVIGLGGGDAVRALERMRRVSEEGLLARTEARWVYANALLREGARDASLREEGLRIIGELALQFPENPVFRRQVSSGSAP